MLTKTIDIVEMYLNRGSAKYLDYATNRWPQQFQPNFRYWNRHCLNRVGHFNNGECFNQDSLVKSCHESKLQLVKTTRLRLKDVEEFMEQQNGFGHTFVRTIRL